MFRRQLLATRLRLRQPGWYVSIAAAVVLALAAVLPYPVRLVELPILLVLPGCLVVAALTGSDGISLRSVVVAISVSFVVLIGTCLLLTTAGVRLSSFSVSVSVAGLCVVLELYLLASRMAPQDELAAASERGHRLEGSKVIRLGWAVAGLGVIIGATMAMRAAWPPVVSPPYVGVGVAGPAVVSGSDIRIPLILRSDRAGTYHLSWPGSRLAGDHTIALGRHPVRIALRERRSYMCQSVVLVVDGPSGHPSTSLTFVPAPSSAACPL